MWPLAVLGLAASLAAAERADSTYLIDLWNSDRGLPQNTVMGMVQTRDGYLWLATFGGLARFDGVNFTIFNASNSPGLRSSRFTALFEDRDGVLWIGTEDDGVARYDHGRFAMFGAAAGAPGRLIHYFAQDRDGTVWAGGTDGIARWDGRAFQREPMPDAITHADTMCLLADRDGRLWAGTRSGVAVFERGRTRAFTMASGLPDNLITSLGQGADGTIWIGTGRGLMRWNGDAPSPSTLVPPYMITAIVQGRDAFWIGTSANAAYRCVDGICSQVTALLDLPDHRVRSFVEDRQGNIWFGLDIEGLVRLKKRHVMPHQVLDGREHQSVVPVVGDGQGGVWIGATCGGRSYGGLLHWHEGAFTSYGEKDGVPHDCVWALWRDPDGTLWIGTAGEGVARWRDRRSTVYSTGEGLPSPVVKAIIRDRRGDMWFGTNSGLSRFDGKRIVTYARRDGLVDDGIHAIVEDRSGALWIGTTGGVSRLKDGRFENFTTANGLPQNNIRAIYEDRAGVIWIVSFGGGLTRYTDGRFATISSRHGLDDDMLSIVLEDDRGNFWLTGLRGVFRVPRDQLNAVADRRLDAVTTVSYTVADGMPVNECSGGGQPAGWRGGDGRLWIPTVRGVVEIDPQVGSPQPPSVLMEDVTPTRVAGAFVPGMTLPAGKGDLEFHYTAIDLTSPEKVRFKYRLDGYDDHWIDAGSRRVAYYTNVPAGPHTFRVAARNGEGVWNETGATASFSVAPYFYQTWPFMLLSAVAVAAAFVGASRLRVARLTRRTRELEQKVAQRTAEVVDQKDRLTEANDRLAHANQDLLSLLNELRVGAITTDRDGRVVFVSETAAPLVAASGAPDRSSWAESLPIDAGDRDTLREMARQPSQRRVKVPVRMNGAGGRHYWMEIDVKDDPRDPAAKIVFLYDVSEVYDLRRLLDDRTMSAGIVGQSAPVQLLHRQIRDVSRVDTTVLVEGETGAGKELVARAIHDASVRRSRPFVPVNCAGLTESLLASQLFGHRRGAFTGANDDHVGLFESANQGTLFLDEIGDIPPTVQMSLLRVLQEREITRLGDSRPRKIDVRVIAATHRDLAAEVAAGRFRQDLLYRIRVARIVVPSLRDHRQDIPLLVAWFLGQARTATGKAIHDVTSDVMDTLMRHPWPGNVRELKSAIDSAAIGARGAVIQLSDLPPEILDAGDRRPAGEPVAIVFAGSEREQIEAAIARAGGNRAAAARLLGVSRATFYRRLRMLGIDAGPETGA
jgi:DNA-binding NtrC family response regulator/ligand-binding sensor domain-containing protein/PAS domain-containing protein